jgi:ribonuclease Z
MKVIFLGTGGAVPTLERSHPSIAVFFNGEYILLDAGEGTQKQIMKSGLGFARLTRIFISHLHGDHFLGLFPLIQTLSLLRRKKRLEIYSPSGLRDVLHELVNKAYLEPRFEVDVKEVNEDSSFDFGKYEVSMFHVYHGDTQTFGIRVKEADKPGEFDVKKANELGVPVTLRGLLQRGIAIKTPSGRVVFPHDVLGPPRKGKLLVYSADTRPCKTVIHNAMGADLLIHDATFRDDLKDRAEKTGHSTVGEACNIAMKAGVKKLALTHFSARYKGRDLDKIEREAKDLFYNAFVARDLLSVTL